MKPARIDGAKLDKVKAAYVKAITAAWPKLARDLATQITAAMGKMAKAQNLDENADPDQSADIILASLDFSAWQILIDPTEEQLASVLEDAGKAVLAQLGVTATNALDQVHQDALDYAQARAAELVGMKQIDGVWIENPSAKWAITESTRDMIRGTVSQAINEGWSRDRLATELETTYSFSEARAETIAQTELNRANSTGAMNGYRRSGVVSKKVWLLSNDYDAKDDDGLCEDNADQGPIGLDENFASGDDAPPAHINCRCDVAAIVSDDSQEEGDDS